MTIPEQLRDAAGLGPGSEVEFRQAEGGILIRKSQAHPTRGEQLVARLRGRGDVAMTTDEIMALTRGE